MTQTLQLTLFPLDAKQAELPVDTSKIEGIEKKIRDAMDKVNGQMDLFEGKDYLFV